MDRMEALAIIRNKRQEKKMTFQALGQAVGRNPVYMAAVLNGQQRLGPDEEKKLAAALQKGLADTKTISADEIIAALPKALISGGDVDQLKQIIVRYRNSLYPDKVTIDVEAAERVLKSEEVANVLKPQQVNLKVLLDTAVLQS